jgi:6-phosphofructokinase 2
MMNRPALPNGDNRATIVTLTMNPALDITTSVDRVRPTDKLRCRGARHDPGGGGINVARVAHALGASAAAVFPAGGPPGQVVADLLAAARVPFHRVRIGGRTRESFTVNEESSGQQYRFVLPGPRLTFAEWAQCVDELRTAAGFAQFVVVSGSLPPDVPADFCQQIADVCGDLGTRLVLDTSGTGLAHLPSGVFLLKPSVRELRECVGRELATEAEQVAAAQELVQRGQAQVVVVSLGPMGALLITPHAAQRVPAIEMGTGSGVGAGDAMVAALTVGLSRGWPLSKSVRFGVAAGAAMLRTPGTAVCSRGDVERLFELVAEPVDLGAAGS